MSPVRVYDGLEGGMPMIELFFVTCLIDDPQVCTDHSLLFEERNGLFTCMLEGQSELARWVEAHPRDRVKEWKCRRPRQGETAL
ncbi:MAG: hypothetical protein ACU0C5_03485 [Paracoccus sp. (in: a-proteobacteria)]|uniref:hypothetical protein n=1 Tax=Paracoccus sp. TaxID=267 RepID=UPI004058FF19